MGSASSVICPNLDWHDGCWAASAGAVNIMNLYLIIAAIVLYVTLSMGTWAPWLGW